MTKANYLLFKTPKIIRIGLVVVSGGGLKTHRCAGGVPAKCFPIDIGESAPTSLVDSCVLNVFRGSVTPEVGALVNDRFSNLTIFLEISLLFERLDYVVIQGPGAS